ncbi:Antirestriction protein klcA [Klebsiella pneumoniae]|nr:Antirestriction protein klcA [Klebsiella pneumoniae]
MTTQTQCELMSANEPQFDLTATPIPDEQRLDFWQLYFGDIPQWIIRRQLPRPHRDNYSGLFVI